MVNFSVATNERYTDSNGERQDHTEWHRIVAWGKLADLCKRTNCVKGGVIAIWIACGYAVGMISVSI